MKMINSCKLLLFVSLSLGLFSSCSGEKKVVGWFVGNNSKFDHFPWSCYTHIHNYGPLVDDNGFATCDKNNTEMLEWIEIIHNHSKKAVWGLGLKNFHNVLWGDAEQMGINYINTIGKAVEDCNIDGIEVDYEWQDTNWGKIGIIPALKSTKYTKFLSAIKKQIGPYREVSADVSIWGIQKGEYVLGFFPWINVTMLNSGEIDYINTMSYHYTDRDSIWAWEKDGLVLHTLWGIDKNRVNIGVPFYNVVGKKLMDKQTTANLGKWIGDNGWRGAFIFAATYDHYNNPLIYDLCKGLQS